ncbi:MAG: MarR family transcriptional regulator [Clostridia bacterium]|nr:MarR family transcriptional regulator [Clostridia bacterium]
MCSGNISKSNSERSEALFNFPKMVFRFADLLMDMTTKNATPLQLGILLKLSEQGQQPISSVADQMRVAKPNMTVLIDELCNKGFVSRTPSTKDRRVIMIDLTPEGKKYMEETMVNIEIVLEKVLSALAPDEKTEFLSIYPRLYKLGNKVLDSYPGHERTSCPFHE